MKKAKLILIMLTCCIVSAFADNGNGDKGTENSKSSSPTWEFTFCVAEPTDQQLAETADDTEFGKKCAFLFNQLQNLCVKRIPVVPGDPTTRISIKKGDLFNAVRKISKGLSDDVKDHKLSEEVASDQMAQVLNVAISAFYSDDSKPFEKALRNGKKDYKQLVSMFSQVALK